MSDEMDDLCDELARDVMDAVADQTPATLAQSLRRFVRAVVASAREPERTVGKEVIDEIIARRERGNG